MGPSLSRHSKFKRVPDSEVDVELTISPITDKHGKVIGWLSQPSAS